MTTGIGAAAAAPKKWTILYYFDGKNNLAPIAEHSFKSLDEVRTNDDVNLVAQIGLPKQKTMQGLIRGTGTAGFQSVGNVDMGSGDNIKQFLEWGMKNYPAEHYALVVWDHGAGFKGSCVDEETHHLITNKDMAQALEQTYKDTGKKLEVLNWNCCLMNQAETGYELRNAANYMVGSEEVEAGLRIPIPGVFGTSPQHLVAKDIQEAVKTKGDLSGEELAKLMVFEAKNQFGATMFTPTQSAIQLDKMGEVRDKSEVLAGALLDQMKADPSMVETLRKDIKKSQHFLAADMYIKPYTDYHDLGDFCRVLLKSDKYTPAVKAAAQGVERAEQNAVIAEFHAPASSMGGKSLEGSTGLSVYLTRNYGFDKAGKSSIDNVPSGGTQGHELTSWGAASKWDEMLTTIAKDDDFSSKHPTLLRQMENVGPIANIEGYNWAYNAARGMTAAKGLDFFPLAGFPYFLPLPGQATAAMGILGGGLRIKKGIDKTLEGIQRTDSPKANRTHLIGNGLVDTAIGVGSVVTCAGMIAGAGPAIMPFAVGTLALGLGRMAYNLGKSLYHRHQVKGMDVQAKIDAMADTRPQFAGLAPAAPAAQAAPAAKAAPQPPAPAPAPTTTQS